MGKFWFADAICKSNCAGCGACKSKETRLCERTDGNAFTLNSYYDIPVCDISLLKFPLHCE